MPRNCPTGLKAHLQQNCTTVATCLQIIRTDGVHVCLSTCRTPMTISGDTYLFGPGFEPTAISCSVGAPGDMELTVILSSAGINASDILAGKYAGALVNIFWVDYVTPSNGIMLLKTGYISEVVLGDISATIQVKDLLDLLKQQVGEQYSSCCRVRNWADAQCDPAGGLTPSNFRFAWTVSGVISPFQVQFTAGATSPSGSYYQFGKCTFTAGLNDGVTRIVAADTHVSGTVCTLTFYEALPFAVSVGDIAILEKGCSRLFSACQSYPSTTNTSGTNQENFRGEPLFPGTADLITVGR